MLPNTWQEILNGPSVVLNIDSAQDRAPVIMDRIRQAGFTNLERISAVDGKHQDMKALWAKENVEAVNAVAYKFDSDGQAACTLSHTYTWKDMITKQTPFLTIFEDDVLFHKDFNALAPAFYNQTPKDTDILYLGSQCGGKPTDPLVIQRSLFCTHAYVITLKGAQKLYDMMRYARELYIIDCMIKNVFMDSNSNQLKWLSWNGTNYPDPARHNLHEYRNDGLVYQDSSFETNIHNQNTQL